MQNLGNFPNKMDTVYSASSNDVVVEMVAIDSSRNVVVETLHPSSSSNSCMEKSKAAAWFMAAN